METSLIKSKRYLKIIIIVASVLIVGVAAVGTTLLLKHFTPLKTTTDNSSQPVADTTSPKERAAELYSKGDYAGAKKEYQALLETYKSENNEVAAKDVEMILQTIDATASAPQPPQNTDKGRVVIGSEPKQ